MAVDKQTILSNNHHHQQNNEVNEETSSSSSSSSPHQEECPLCLEDLDFDDRSFFPCTCGYQICRFCWHKILSETDSLLGEQGKKGSCPACRKPYSEDPANFKPLSSEELKAHHRTLQKQKKQQRTTKKISVDKIDKSKLQDLRVVQKNLVFVVGITPKIADPELLKKNEYFGRFGKIRKIVVNHQIQQQNQGGSSGGVTYGAYVTFVRSTSALKAIQSVNNVAFDGKTIKASLGTTKYCSHFMRGQACPKTDCMYLHGLGDPHASFTKEDMQQGKHQEYERRLLAEFCEEERLSLVKEEAPAVSRSEESSAAAPPPLISTTANNVVAPSLTPPLTQQNNHHHHQEEEEEEESFESLIMQPQESHLLIDRQQNFSCLSTGEVLQENHIKEPFPLQQQQQPLEEPSFDPTNDLDFDPFYETQKAFESIIQQEMMNFAPSQQQNNAPPPGFHQQQQYKPNGFGGQQQRNEFDDPAIIFSSSGVNSSNSMNGGGFDGFLMRNSDYYPQNHAENYQQQNSDLLYYFQQQSSSYKNDSSGLYGQSHKTDSSGLYEQQQSQFNGWMENRQQSSSSVLQKLFSPPQQQQQQQQPPPGFNGFNNNGF